jgi:hypothetical protein
MSFNKINRRAEHPRMADKSAVCAINRHLQWVEKPHRGCPGEFVHVHENLPTLLHTGGDLISPSEETGLLGR